MGKLSKIISVCILIITLTGCGGGGGSENSKLGPDTHIIKYEVSSSTQNVSITYIDEDGKTVNLPNENSHDHPWAYTFTAKNGSHLALSAQLLGSEVDTIYVIIFLDNKEVARELSYSVGVTANTEYDIPLN